MPNLTSVGITNGIPSSGTGTVSTLDAVLAVLPTALAANGGLLSADVGPSWTTVWGVSGVPFTSADATSVASVTDAPTSGQKIVVDDLIFSVDTAMTVTFKCETTGTVIAGPYYMPPNGTVHETFRGKGWKLATADKKLQVITSAAGNIMVLAGYHSEA